jgi:sugar lactone lactonase YvrE
MDYLESRQIAIPATNLSLHSIAACRHYNCLYASDYQLKQIHRVDLSNSLVVIKWSVNGTPAGLFVTRDHHILVTLFSSNTICQYTTYGQLIHTINLETSKEAPQHSVKLFSGHFALCHLGSRQHRVCIVDTTGHIVYSYGGSEGSSAGQLNVPCYLALDKRGYLYIADYNNEKIKMLSPTLTHLGDITLLEHQLRRQTCMHLDELNGRLYFGEGRDEKRVFVLTESH